MLVLALDTSTPLITVTLASVELGPTVTPLAHFDLDNAFAHTEQLVPLTKAALAEAGKTLPDLDALVVGVGPGPFTGLRVGIATAAALGDGLGVPVYPVPSHQGLAAASQVGESQPAPSQPDSSQPAPAASATNTPGTSATTPAEPGSEADSNPVYLVVTDARRKEVFVTAFEGLHPVLGPTAVSPAALPELLVNNNLRAEYLIGPGASLVTDQLPLPIRELVTDFGLGLIRSAAEDILSSGEPAPLTPLYLRRPDAVEPSKTRKSVLGR